MIFKTSHAGTSSVGRGRERLHSAYGQHLPSRADEMLHLVGFNDVSISPSSTGRTLFERHRLNTVVIICEATSLLPPKSHNLTHNYKLRVNSQQEPIQTAQSKAIDAFLIVVSHAS